MQIVLRSSTVFFVIKWLFSNNSFTLLTSLQLPYNECDKLTVHPLKKTHYQDRTAMLE